MSSFSAVIYGPLFVRIKIKEPNKKADPTGSGSETPTDNRYLQVLELEGDSEDIPCAGLLRGLRRLLAGRSDELAGAGHEGFSVPRLLLHTKAQVFKSLI